MRKAILENTVKDFVSNVCHELYGVNPDFTIERDSFANASVSYRLGGFSSDVLIKLTTSLLRKLNNDEQTIILMHELSHPVFQRIDYGTSLGYSGKREKLNHSAEKLYEEILNLIPLNSEFMTIIPQYPRARNTASKWQSEYFADTFGIILYATFTGKSLRCAGSLMLDALNKLSKINKTETVEDWKKVYTDFLNLPESDKSVLMISPEGPVMEVYQSSHPFIDLRLKLIKNLMRFFVVNEEVNSLRSIALC